MEVVLCGCSRTLGIRVGSGAQGLHTGCISHDKLPLAKASKVAVGHAVSSCTLRH